MCVIVSLLIGLFVGLLFVGIVTPNSRADAEDYGRLLGECELLYKLKKRPDIVNKKLSSWIDTEIKRVEKGLKDYG